MGKSEVVDKCNRAIDEALVDTYNLFTSSYVQKIELEIDLVLRAFRDPIRNSLIVLTDNLEF